MSRLSSEFKVFNSDLNHLGHEPGIHEIPADANTAEVTVLMADGEQKSWLDLREKDQIRNADGRISKLSSGTIIKDVHELYAVNDDAPFLPLDQAVLTLRGWASLAPESTRDANPELKVCRLKVGDVIRRIRIVDGEPVPNFEVVSRINVQHLSNGRTVQVAVPHVRKGRPSFWLNGYCALINYPEWSAHRLASNISNTMTGAEEVLLGEHLREARPLLEQTFGKNVVDAAMTVLAEPDLAAGRLPRTPKPRRYADLHDLTIPRLIALPTEGDPELPPDFDDIAIHHGTLFINHRPVHTKVTGDDLYWTRTTAKGAVESGHITFTPRRDIGFGVMDVDGQRITFTALPKIEYACVFGPDHTHWFDFEVDFDKGPGDSYVAVGRLRHPDGAALSHVAVTFTSTTNKAGEKFLTANIEWDRHRVAWQKGKWIAATINFSLNYATLTGTLYEFDASKPLYRGRHFSLNGKAKNWEALAAYTQLLPELQLASAGDGAFTEAVPASLPESDLAAAMALKGQTKLSVTALYMLPPPDLVELHKDSFATIKNMMLYAIPDKQLKFFGETKPKVGPRLQLTQREADLALKNTTINEFLVNKFSLGYLTLAYSKSTDPKIQKLIGDKATSEKLSYFWQGPGKGCFAQLKGYNLSTAKVMDATYVKLAAGLQAYLDDRPEYWARQLYLYCINPATLNGLAAEDMASGGKGAINHLATMLHALSPTQTVKVGDRTVSYGVALYEMILNMKLIHVSKNFKATNKEDMAEVLTMFFKQYFTELLDGSGNWDTSIRSAAEKDLKAYMASEGIDTLDAKMVHMTAITSDLATLLVNMKSEPITKRLADFAKVNPRFAKFSKAMGGITTMVVLCLGASTLMQTIQNWKHLTPVQKAQAITTIAYSVTKLFNKFALYKAAKKLTDPDSTPSEQFDAAEEISDAMGKQDLITPGDETTRISDPETGDLDAPLLTRAGQTTANTVSEGEELEAATTRWTEIADVSGGFAAALGALAMAGACVATGFQIANDFATDQPVAIKALDIVSEVSNGVAFLATAGLGIAALAGAEVASCIPIVGAVAAVIGIVIAFALIFIHRKPPPTPEETFVKDHCIPFLRSLAAPPEEWIKQRANAQKHFEKKPA